MKLGTRELSQAASCLLGGLMRKYGPNLEATEFRGGRLTGPLLTLYDVGALLFVPALLLRFFSRRISATITVLAFLLCLPLYLYFTAPGPFRQVFGRANFSVPLQTYFVWDRWSVLGMLTLAVAICISLWNLAIIRRKPFKQRRQQP